MDIKRPCQGGAASRRQAPYRSGIRFTRRQLESGNRIANIFNRSLAACLNGGGYIGLADRQTNCRVDGVLFFGLRLVKDSQLATSLRYGAQPLVCTERVGRLDVC